MTKKVSGLPVRLTELAAEIHADNIRAGWWKREMHLLAMRTVPRNIGELLCLVHSEISEADEGIRGGLMDDKLPHRPMFEVELADTAIRVLDILGYHGVDVLAMQQEGGPLALPMGPDSDEWLLLMHRTTSAAMEHCRKARRIDGCRQLVKLLGVLHFCAVMFSLDLTGAIEEKRAFNAQREDHKLEVRALAGGKQF